MQLIYSLIIYALYVSGIIMLFNLRFDKSSLLDWT